MYIVCIQFIQVYIVYTPYYTPLPQYSPNNPCKWWYVKRDAFHGGGRGEGGQWKQSHIYPCLSSFDTAPVALSIAVWVSVYMYAKVCVCVCVCLCALLRLIHQRTQKELRTKLNGLYKKYI